LNGTKKILIGKNSDLTLLEPPTHVMQLKDP
jgi:hypothetical protein